jgi:LAO/AO transport system kinase
MWQQLLDQISTGDAKVLARSISLVENEQKGFETFLEKLPPGHAAVIGITGPPGAGKSTLTDGLIGEMITAGKKIAVLCVDPSSPFHLGAVLGDRIRMSEWYMHPNVFIRSLATRGALGGLHPRIIEISELVKAAQFDYVIIETVGVGQSEVEIAGLADTTVVVLVPEAGDEVQTMKAGLMEIADIFVVNKTDRPDADRFVQNLKLMLAPGFSTYEKQIPVIKTVAQEKQGLDELFKAINDDLANGHSNKKRSWLLAEKAWKIIQANKMKGMDKQQLLDKIEKIPPSEFNLYRFVKPWID